MTLLVAYCEDCDSIHPVDAECKPWGEFRGA